MIQVEHVDEVLRHALVLSEADSFFKPKDTAPVFSAEAEDKPVLVDGDEDDSTASTLYLGTPSSWTN